jgi:S-adenosyl-L-methionine hydrolase (adenosine-forming)
MKGVMAGITPDAHIIDITHNVMPQNVPSGAWILASSYRYFPKNTVYVCVVDPGVGSVRKAIAVHAGDWFFVGPDNGLFSYIMAEQPIHAATLLTNATYHLPTVSSTFHGRDIFAPVGAYLARGLTEIFHELGTPVDPATLQRLQDSGATRHGTTIDAHIIHIDNFGNLITSIPLTLVPELFTASQLRIVFPGAGKVVEKRRQFFAEGPNDRHPFIYGDSSGYVGIAVRNGNAAQTLDVRFGAHITCIISA